MLVREDWLTETEFVENAKWLVKETGETIYKSGLMDSMNVVIAVYCKHRTDDGSPNAHFSTAKGFDHKDALTAMGQLLSNVGVNPAALYAIALVKKDVSNDRRSPHIAVFGINMGDNNRVRINIEMKLNEQDDLFYPNRVFSTAVGSSTIFPHPFLDTIVNSYNAYDITERLTAGFKSIQIVGKNNDQLN